jgi:hypothetical protein
MKTKSIASIAAVLGSTAVLNLGALAGPGPQPQFQTRPVSKQKIVPTPSGKVTKAPTAAKSMIQSGPSLTYVTGGKGNTYAVYRW